ncbi:MAG: nucleotide exchange factor GrpE [Actinomycetaceae bacterium]|nr:nucleotide exchange factor GrpE [Actinomycetaceae bacterium]
MVDTHSDDAREPQCDEAGTDEHVDKADHGNQDDAVCDCNNETADKPQASNGNDHCCKDDEAQDRCENTEANSSVSTHEQCESSAEETDSENSQSTQSEADPQETIAKLGDDLALARADLFNLRKEYTNYVRRAKEAASDHHKRGQAAVLESLIAVLDDIAAARDAGDLQEGPFAAIAEKLENILKTNYHMERYGCQGDEFDPQLHDALMAHDNEDVTVATIAQVLQPGYKHGDTILRPTKVIVDNPA